MKKAASVPLFKDHTEIIMPGNLSEVFKNRIVNCARCGKNHREVKFKKLKRPIESGLLEDIAWTYWGLCPKTGEPILMRLY
jgi:hypothetical protein